MSKFTDRFISLPIRVFNVKEEELTGKSEDSPSWMKILPFEISNYKPSYDENEPDILITHVELKNGRGSLVYLHPDKFEELLNKHQQ